MHRVLVGALLALLALHLLCAADRALWEDEIATVRVAQRPVRSYPHAAAGAFEAPMFTLFLNRWVRIGTGDVWLRLLPILFALAGAGVVLGIWSEILGTVERRTALLLLAVSPAFALWGRDVRPYSLFFLLSVATAWAWWRYHRDGRARDAWTAALLSTAAFWAHYAHILQILALAAWPALILRGRARARGVWLLAGPVLTTALAALLWPHWFACLVKDANALSAESSSYHPGGPPGRFAFGLFVFALGETLYPLRWEWVVPAALAFGVAGYAGLRRLARQDRSALWFWVLWGGLPLLILAILGKRFVPRYAFPSVAAFLAIAAVGIAACPRIPRLLLLALVVPSVWSSVNDVRGREHHNQARVEPVREVAAWIRARGFQAGDELVLAPQHQGLSWYLRDAPGSCRTQRWGQAARGTGRLHYVICSAGHGWRAAPDLARARDELEAWVARLGPPHEHRFWGEDPLRDEKARWASKPFLSHRFELWSWEKGSIPFAPHPNSP